MNPRCRPRRRTRLLIKDEADVGAAFHMLAYCFFDILEETDSAKMQEYRSRVFPVVAQYGGKFLVIGGPIDSVERTWRLVFPVLRSTQRNCGWPQRKVTLFSWLARRSRSVMTPSGGQLPHSDRRTSFQRTSFQLRVRDDCIRLTLLSEIVLCGSRRAGSFPSTVSVAQLVERWIVAPVVVGSIPITHPNLNNLRQLIQRLA